MTRIWTVPFGELDDKRVLGQHREVHIIAGLVAAGRSWKGYTPRGLCNVHDAIVSEMKNRSFLSGFYHQTPLRLGACEGQDVAGPVRDDALAVIDLLHDRYDLLARWQGIYKGRVPMPDAYLPLMAIYTQQGGCLHDGRTEKLRDKSVICLICKQAVLINDEWQPRTWTERARS